MVSGLSLMKNSGDDTRERKDMEGNLNIELLPISEFESKVCLSKV